MTPQLETYFMFQKNQSSQTFSKNFYLTILIKAALKYFIFYTLLFQYFFQIYLEH